VQLFGAVKCHASAPVTSCEILQEIVMLLLGRAIAQAVSRWLSTAAARVQTQVWSSGICDGQSGAGAGFLRVLRFPVSIFIPSNSPSSQSPGAGTIGHSVADVPSGPIWTPPPTMQIKKNVAIAFCQRSSHVNLSHFFTRLRRVWPVTVTERSKA
jgi:hypothetical protein